jgi:hypothetical protein
MEPHRPFPQRGSLGGRQMTPGQAIDTLQDLLTTLPQRSPEQRRQAVQLGIEALKRHQQLEKRMPPGTIKLLPTETQERNAH